MVFVGVGFYGGQKSVAHRAIDYAVAASQIVWSGVATPALLCSIDS